MLDRSTRTFWGVGFLVAALMVILWLIVRERPVTEWWLALLLVIVAGLLFLWGRRGASAESRTSAAPAAAEATPLRVREFNIPAAPVLAMSAPAALEPAAPRVVEAAPTAPAPVVASYAKAEAAVPAPGKSDDLQVIEGIGPKMDAALRAEGIDSYRKVADASIADLRAAVEEHGLTFAPSLVNWAKQARYLADGDHPGFEKYRDYLVRGLEPGQVVSRDYIISSAPAAEAPTDPEKPTAKKAPAAPKPKKAKVEAPVVPDDLKVVEGIGPKMEKALNEAGILTFAQLAAASEDTIRAAIEKAGMRFAPSMPTWAKQSSYAAKGDMDGLKVYQSELTAGRAT